MQCVEGMIEASSIKYASLMRNLSEPLSRHFGINYFCYQFVSNEGLWFTLSNNPNWLLYSAEKQFYQYDPSLVQPNTYSSSVCFPKYHEHERFQETLISHAIERFDLDHCLAIIEPSMDGCEYYFFGAPSKHQKIAQIYLHHLSHLRYDYARYVKSNIKPISRLLFEHSVNLLDFNLAQYNSEENRLKVDHDFERSVCFLNEINAGAQLTQRERECLLLYQSGFSAKETAVQLGLSFRTIEAYFETIKNKCAVQNKRDLLKVT